MKTRNSPEYTKSFVHNLTKRLYQVNPDEEDPEALGTAALRQDVTDMHYAQLFFVVGHSAIKLLTYVEHLEAELKRQNAPRAVKKGEEGKETQEDELD